MSVFSRMLRVSAAMSGLLSHVAVGLAAQIPGQRALLRRPGRCFLSTATGMTIHDTGLDDTLAARWRIL